MYVLVFNLGGNWELSYFFSSPLFIFLNLGKFVPFFEPFANFMSLQKGIQLKLEHLLKWAARYLH